MSVNQKIKTGALKFKHPCFLTGKYKGTAHQPCNLNVY